MFTIDITTDSYNMIFTVTLVATNVVFMSLYLTSMCRNKTLKQQLEKRIGYQTEVENSLNRIIEMKDIELELNKKEITKLKTLQITLDKWSEHYQNQITELEATIWEKDEENNKLSGRVSILEKECQERKVDAIKLRNVIKSYKKQLNLVK